MLLQVLDGLILGPPLRDYITQFMMVSSVYKKQKNVRGIYSYEPLQLHGFLRIYTSSTSLIFLLTSVEFMYSVAQFIIILQYVLR